MSFHTFTSVDDYIRKGFAYVRRRQAEAELQSDQAMSDSWCARYEYLLNLARHGSREALLSEFVRIRVSFFL